MNLEQLKKIIPFKFRVWNKTQTWFNVLAYIDSRDCMELLDEVVWPTNWQRKHYEVKGNMYCSVWIKVDNERIRKDDCWTESKTEEEKWEASDAFKRACVNRWIGRFLYDMWRFYITEQEEKANKYDLTKFIKNKYSKELTEWHNSIPEHLQAKK